VKKLLPHHCWGDETCLEFGGPNEELLQFQADLSIVVSADVRQNNSNWLPTKERENDGSFASSGTGRRTSYGATGTAKFDQVSSERRWVVPDETETKGVRSPLNLPAERKGTRDTTKGGAEGFPIG
jgi:hypothetical protein